MTAVEEVRCARCGRPVRPPKTTYCRASCAVVERRRRLIEAQHRTDAYKKWRNATAADSRVQVPLDADSQARARALLAAGVMAGYEDVSGLLRDIGVPKRRTDAGALWSRRMRVERDFRGRVVT